MTLGERVLILRRRRNLSQVELADKVKLAKNTIARLERNDIKNLEGDSIVALARALEISTDELLGMVPFDLEALVDA